MAMKQLETTKVKVGGMNFYIKPFGAFTAANLTGELASVLAPLLGALAPLVTKDGDLMDVDAGEAAKAMSGCTNLDGNKLEKLMRKLLIGGHIVVEVFDDDGNLDAQVLDNDIANEVFCGEVQDMFVLCFHVIKLNFNGFFKKIAAQSGKAKSTMAAMTTQRVIL